MAWLDNQGYKWGGFMIIANNLANKVLFEPILNDVNQLFVVSGYATPNMASWFLKNANNFIEAHRLNKKIELKLIVGMAPFDGLSISVHEGFQELCTTDLPKYISEFMCSYIYDNVPIHSKLYIWAKNEIPVVAFMGSANFSQMAFGSKRNEILVECNAIEAYEYYLKAEEKTIYCTHGEIEDHIILYPAHPILDNENKLNQTLQGTDIEKVALSLLSKTGETGTKSGINWGQRDKRNPNQAYIGLPSKIAKMGFFPLNKQHFTVITDDGHQLILRVEQENNKAITTPLSNAQLGEYLRNRIGVANGAYVTKGDLIRYGRTDIDFYKLDEEQYYMDFSI